MPQNQISQREYRKQNWKSIDGALISGDPVFLDKGATIANALRAARMPAVFPWRQRHEYGVLISYGPDIRNAASRAAYYVDKILKGTKPADLPVEQVSKGRSHIDLRVAQS
jgi:ABC-type uncharacterized transport system substrate-binding protein